MKWPAEMALTVERRSELLMLLYLAEEFGVPAPRDMPPLLSDPPAVDVDGATVNEIQAWWDLAWDAALAMYRSDAPIGSHARSQIITRSPEEGSTVPPAPQLVLDALDTDAPWAWFREVLPADGEVIVREDSLLRGSLDALIPAWRGGLGRILVLPYRGEYAERLSVSTLVVSPLVMESPSGLRRALAVPPRSA